MVGSGIFLVLLAGGILSLENLALVRYIMGEPIEAVAVAIAGIALASTPLWLVPRLAVLRDRHHERSLILDHQVRNRLREIIGETEILGLHIKASENSVLEDLRIEMLSSIKSIRNSSFALIESLRGITQSCGGEMRGPDYSLAMKQHEAPNDAQIQTTVTGVVDKQSHNDDKNH